MCNRKNIDSPMGHKVNNNRTVLLGRVVPLTPAGNRERHAHFPGFRRVFGELPIIERKLYRDHSGKASHCILGLWRSPGLWTIPVTRRRFFPGRMLNTRIKSFWFITILASVFFARAFIRRAFIASSVFQAIFCNTRAALIATITSWIGTTRLHQGTGPRRTDHLYSCHI